MNAPAQIDLSKSKDDISRSPRDLAITVRDRRFARENRPERWWLGGDPVASAWMNSLSATFPRGEAFFIDAVKAHRDGAPPRLAAEIRAFVKQEINHTREHIVFNRLAEDAGYDIAFIDEKVKAHLEMTRGRPKIVDLAATMALEHFTAIFGKELLQTPAHLEGADAELAAMWRWHAIEEIEHKGVAFDTWLHATRDWSGWKRWRLRSLLMVLATKTFLSNRIADVVELLRQDGLTGAKWKWRIAAYLLFEPGLLRRIFPAWCAYFLPGFHPWKHDDRALISRSESNYADAVVPAE